MTKEAAVTANNTWFHVFKSMIDSGDLATLTGSEIKTYLVIKSCVNFRSGISYPAVKTISKKTGMSQTQVKRCVKSLEKRGYIKKSKKGRNNVYTMIEQVHCNNDKGESTAIATWDYLPGKMKEAQSEKKDYLNSGTLNGKFVTITNLTINITENNTSNICINNNLHLDDIPNELKTKLKSIYEKLNHR